MACSPEQHRKKEEALRESEAHLKDTVDGNRGRSEHNSHMAHMPKGGMTEGY